MGIDVETCEKEVKVSCAVGESDGLAPQEKIEIGAGCARWLPPLWVGSGQL